LFLAVVQKSSTRSSILLQWSVALSLACAQ
jgi:hypothetical protein